MMDDPCECWSKEDRLKEEARRTVEEEVDKRRALKEQLRRSEEAHKALADDVACQKEEGFLSGSRTCYEQLQEQAFVVAASVSLYALDLSDRWTSGTSPIFREHNEEDHRAYRGQVLEV